MPQLHPRDPPLPPPICRAQRRACPGCGKALLILKTSGAAEAVLLRHRRVSWHRGLPEHPPARRDGLTVRARPARGGLGGGLLLLAGRQRLPLGDHLAGRPEGALEVGRQALCDVPARDKAAAVGVQEVEEAVSRGESMTEVALEEDADLVAVHVLAVVLVHGHEDLAGGPVALLEELGSDEVPEPTHLLVPLGLLLRLVPVAPELGHLCAGSVIGALEVGLQAPPELLALDLAIPFNVQQVKEAVCASGGKTDVVDQKGSHLLPIQQPIIIFVNLQEQLPHGLEPFVDGSVAQHVPELPQLLIPDLLSSPRLFVMPRGGLWELEALVQVGGQTLADLAAADLPVLVVIQEAEELVSLCHRQAEVHLEELACLHAV
mmetsp:Transcript_5667/g.16416  ORF Transcript_5667/g.16416 Transcript_5667/m.16416 type:complete len:376 (+) Transcript_5667:152-1279(+)